MCAYRCVAHVHTVRVHTCACMHECTRMYMHMCVSLSGDQHELTEPSGLPWGPGLGGLIPPHREMGCGRSLHLPPRERLSRGARDPGTAQGGPVPQAVMSVVGASRPKSPPCLRHSDRKPRPPSSGLCFLKCKMSPAPPAPFCPWPHFLPPGEGGLRGTSPLRGSESGPLGPWQGATIIWGRPAGRGGRGAPGRAV